MSATTKTEVFTINEHAIWGRHFPTLERELTVDDYEVSAWRLPTEYNKYSGDNPTACATLTLKQEVYDHIQAVSNPNNDWNEGVLTAQTRFNKEAKTHTTVAVIGRQLSFRGVRKAAQKTRWEAAVAEITSDTKNEEKARAAIQRSIDADNKALREWTERARRRYVQDGVRAALENRTEEMAEAANVGPLTQQIEVLRAQLDGLYKARQKKWESYLRKEWEEDTEYPEELREAVLEGIKEGRANTGRRLFGYSG